MTELERLNKRLSRPEVKGFHVSLNPESKESPGPEIVAGEINKMLDAANEDQNNPLTITRSELQTIIDGLNRVKALYIPMTVDGFLRESEKAESRQMVLREVNSILEFARMMARQVEERNHVVHLDPKDNL